jgi:hypothetical protein
MSETIRNLLVVFLPLRVPALDDAELAFFMRVPFGLLVLLAFADIHCCSLFIVVDFVVSTFNAL